MCCIYPTIENYEFNYALSLIQIQAVLKEKKAIINTALVENKLESVVLFQ